MWPQPLHPDLPHLPCIHATPKGDVEDLLFGDAGEDVFLLIRTDGLTGLGSIDNKLLGGLLDFVCQCDAWEQQLSLEEQRLRNSERSIAVTKWTSNLFCITYNVCLALGWRMAQRTIRHLQRTLLEWDAWLRCWEVFLPRMVQVQTRASESDLTAIGCFVYQTEDAEMHFMILYRPFLTVCGSFCLAWYWHDNGRICLQLHHSIRRSGKGDFLYSRYSPFRPGCDTGKCFLARQIKFRKVQWRALWQAYSIFSDLGAPISSVQCPDMVQMLVQMLILNQHLGLAQNSHWKSVFWIAFDPCLKF